MKRTRLPGVVDIVRVNDPVEIRGLLDGDQLDRRFDGRWPMLNGFLLRRVIGALSFRKRRFPTLQPREDRARSQGQNALWEDLSDRAANLTVKHPDVQSLARWVHGAGNSAEVGILAQQAIGRLFLESYAADSASWAAALVLRDAAQGKGIAALAPFFTGKLRKAKELLAEKVNGELSGLHGTGVAVHNLVNSFHRMRLLYADITQRSQRPEESIARECLFAPGAVLRQATGDGERSGCPYLKSTVFILELGAAHNEADSMDMVFLENTWSRCPAEKWVPALLETVWKCANNMTAQSVQTPDSSINSETRNREPVASPES